MASSSFLLSDPGRGQVLFEQEELDQRFLQCNVCYDKFDQRSRVPKILPSCHHTFCQSCLQELLNAVRPASSAVAHRYQGYVRYTNQLNTMYHLSCPACRQISTLNTRNAHTLHTDYKVLDMVDFFKAKKKSSSYCSSHQQPMNFFCETCMVPICRDCTVLEHKERDGHSFLDIKEAFTRFESAMKNQVYDTQELEKRYELRETSLKQQLQELSDTHMNSEDAIDSFFNECVRRLEDRRNKLKEELNTAVENVRTSLQESLETVASKREMLQDKATALHDGISGGDLHEAFSIHKELRDRASALNPDSGINDNWTAVKFTTAHQEEFSNLLETLGRVDQPLPNGWVRAVESPPPPDRVSVGTNTASPAAACPVEATELTVSTMTSTEDDEQF